MGRKNKEKKNIPQSPQPKEAFSTGQGEYIQVDSRPWSEQLADMSHWNFLPFSHGIEMELVICDEKGAYIEGENVVFIMNQLINEAKSTLKKLFKGETIKGLEPLPKYMRDKLASQVYIKEYEDKGKNLGFDYKISNDYWKGAPQIRTDAFGRDGNITMSTIILEIVTPPCQYAQELAYWSSCLFNLAQISLPKGFFIMSTAINPTIKEYINGLSHGDHHHSGSFASDQEKIFCYNLARNFLPNIIALTVNSPFINNAPTDVIKSKMINGKPRYTAPNCMRSIRLHNNTTMLSNSHEFHKYIPYLISKSIEEDKKLFLATTEYASLYDARFQDLFPFTKYDTIELRICDAQLSIARRIGMAMLLQTIYYKARKLLKQEIYVPAVNSETLCVNRRSAIERGLIGVLKTPGLTREFLNQFDSSGVFADCYLGPVSGRPYRFLFEQTQGMFRYLKPELKELGYLQSPFLKPLLQSVFGEISYAQPPLCESEYQLALYDWKMKKGEQPDLVKTLIYYTKEYSKDPIQQPLTGELKLPDYML
jgi:hypothetical protein